MDTNTAHGLLSTPGEHQANCDAPEWQPGKIYNWSDKVIRHGILYKCISGHGWSGESYDPDKYSGPHAPQVNWERLWPCRAAQAAINPIVHLQSPADRMAYQLSSLGILDIIVKAETADGHIAILECRINGNLIGRKESITTGEHSFSWKNIAEGDHIISALIQDRNGASASDNIQISIKGNEPQQQHLHILSPSDGQTYLRGEVIIAEVDLRQLSGKVGRLQFYIDGQLINTLSLVTDKHYFTYSTASLTPTAHLIQIAAFDRNGLTLDTEQVYINVKEKEALTVIESAVTHISVIDNPQKRMETIESPTVNIYVKEKSGDDSVIINTQHVPTHATENEKGAFINDRATRNKGFLQETTPIVLGYFGSWKETYPQHGSSKLSDLPPYINHVFLGFAKPDMRYVKGSFDISDSGLEPPYKTQAEAGKTLRETVKTLHAKGIRIILSIGGETYWRDNGVYDRINYLQIKDLVDDIGFDGIDWDYEPDGSFANIGRPLEVSKFIEMFERSRELMPRSEGYLLACAPAGAGAMGGPHTSIFTNDDPDSPFAYHNRFQITGEERDYFEGFQPHNIVLFNFSSTGHMIPVIKRVGREIDLIAYQGYNAGAAPDRTLMYDAYAYYANQYGFRIAAGIHVPNEPWGPYYTFTPEKIAELANYVRGGGKFNRKGDGLMIWELNLLSAIDQTHSGVTYMKIAYEKLNNRIYIDPPNIQVSFPGIAGDILTPVDLPIQVSVTDVNEIAEVTIFGDSQQLAYFNSPPYNSSWRGLAAGTHTVEVRAKNNKGAMATTARPITVYSMGKGCNVPEWDPTRSYPSVGYLVSYHGKVYRSRYWVNPGQVPGGVWDWEELGECIR